jgi:hypothetical protein
MGRIDLLNKANKPQWGKMTVAQMARHCALCEEYYCGGIYVKRSFLGRLLGKVAIKSILKDEASGFRKNAGAPPQLRAEETDLDLETEKANWKRLIGEYGSFKIEKFNHWFFGEMTKEQLGQLIYKHNDHHLRQFGV